MPIGIGVTGGLVRYDKLQNVSSDEALGSLERIKTHLSQPGRDSGVLTLFNRSSKETEMTLERKSSFQLLFHEDDRLDDTVHALKTMLQRAGKHEAVVELENYLSDRGGKQNRIESSKMLDILKRHLPTQAPPQERIEPPKPLKVLKPIEAPSLDGLYKKAKVERGKELGSGAYGTTFLVKVGGKQQVLKEFGKPQPLSLDRGSKPNEAMGSYLTSKNHPNYLTETVNISQPTSYLVSLTKDEGEQYRMVTPHEMRKLVRDSKETGSEVLCHGIIMPKAEGQEVGKLLKTGLKESEKKQIVQSTLQSIKGLHERGFVHRDIKLENCLFDRKTKTTTLIDTGTLFKTSKDLQKHPGSESIDPQEFAGTRRYVHPRGLGLQQNYGTETDLHALGVMTLELARPGIFDLLGDPFLNGVTKDWVLRKLDQGIKDNPPNRDQLEALRRDLDNPNTTAGFAMLCIERAGLSHDDWNNRDWAQETYSKLLEHPFLQ